MSKLGNSSNYPADTELTAQIWEAKGMVQVSALLYMIYDMKASMQSATSAIDILQTEYYYFIAFGKPARVRGDLSDGEPLVKMCIETINLRLVTFLPRTPRTLLVLVVWLFAFFKMSSIYPWAGNR